MSRSERWNTPNEIKRNFPEVSAPGVGAGPIIMRNYCDDSEAHIGVYGRTGMGKSQCCSLPYVWDIFDAGESQVVLDPKGELLKHNLGHIPPEYQTIVIDFRNPRKSPNKWNPLDTPYQLFVMSDNPDDHDIASSMISEFWSSVYPLDAQPDKFWPESAANYAKGLTYGLLEAAKDGYIEKKHVNLESVAVMMDESETRTMGSSTLLKDFYETLLPKSLAKRNLAAYVTGPNDTRASIHSVAASGLEVFSRSKGLMELLGEDTEDTFKILDIDVERPFAIFIITPDETDVYSQLSGILVTQITQHLIRVAQERGGRLPIRVNIILEELGSVGKSIPSLPNLMVAGRSRNIRIMLLLQSISQLTDVYGKSKAETINSCIGITIGFSTNNWETLSEWSQRCGERTVENGNSITKEPLITASQLAAMPAGTALVLIDSRYKFISQLPFFYELHSAPNDWHEQPQSKTEHKSTMEIVDLAKLIRKIKANQMNNDVVEQAFQFRKRPPAPSPFPFFDSREEKDEAPLDIDDLVAKIDAKIAELENEEKAEIEKTRKEAKYRVMIADDQGNRARILKVIIDSTGMSFAEAMNKLNMIPCVISFDSKKKAAAFKKEIENAGGMARLLPILDKE